MTYRIKKRAFDYPTVDELPPGALSVGAFADKLGLSHSQIYKLYRQGKLKARGGDIVLFQGVNFVIPATADEPQPEPQ